MPPPPPAPPPPPPPPPPPVVPETVTHEPHTPVRPSETTIAAWGPGAADCCTVTVAWICPGDRTATEARSTPGPRLTVGSPAKPDPEITTVCGEPGVSVDGLTDETVGGTKAAPNLAAPCCGRAPMLENSPPSRSEPAPPSTA